ncbi:ap2 domain transcription factor ap2ix-8 [Cystoisospora suis]|uniref:Ap2 domain transcription factor ap2ix-8 n=1 Tax=Cystoisospora suis TaxID=483139 RepID=A0A2C6LBN7_9APIC|nr:ap2 domain transcription factor ap2ix-8 [Cystoisospora suis]
MESRKNSRGFVGCYSHSDHTSVTIASSTTASTNSLRPSSKVASLPSSALSSSSSCVGWDGCCLDTTTATTSSTAAPTPSAPVTPSSLCISAGEAFFSYTTTTYPSPSSFSLAPTPECLSSSESSPCGSHRGNSGWLHEGGGEVSSVTEEHCCQLGEELTRPNKNHSILRAGEGSTQNHRLDNRGGECPSVSLQPSSADTPQSRLSALPYRPTSGHSFETTRGGSSSVVYPPSSSASGEVYLGEGSFQSSQQMIRGMSLNTSNSLNEDTSNRSTSGQGIGLAAPAGAGFVPGFFGSSLSFPTTTSSTLDDFGKTTGQFCLTGLGCMSSQTTSSSLSSSTTSSDSICADSSPTTTSTTIGPQHQQAPSSHQQGTQQEDATRNNSNAFSSASSSTVSLSSFPPFSSPLGTGGVIGNTTITAAGPPFPDFTPTSAFCTMGTDGGLFFAPSQNSTNALPSPTNPPGGGGGTTPTGATGGVVVGGGGGIHQHNSVFLPSAPCGASGAPPPPQQQQQQQAGGAGGGGNAGSTLFGGGGQPGANGSSNSNNATTGLPSQQQAFASSPRMIGGGNNNNNPGGCLLPSAGSNCYGLPYSFTGACGWPSPPLSLNPSSLLLSGPSGGMISPVHSTDGRFAITSLSRPPPPDGTGDLLSSNSSSGMSSQPQPSSSVRGGEGGTGGGNGLSQGAPPPALQCLGLGGTTTTAGGANMMGFPQQVQMNSANGNGTANACGLPGSIPALAGGGMMSPSMMLGPPVGGATNGAPGGGVSQQQMIGSHLGSGLTSTGGQPGSGPDGMNMFSIGAGGAMMSHTTTATTHLQSAGFGPAGTPPPTGGGVGIGGGGVASSTSNVPGGGTEDGGASALDIQLPKKYSGIWFDPQQNCWRASWVCAKTGKRKFRYFSAAKFGHQHALHLAKMTKERAMERKKVRLQAEANERQRLGDPSAAGSAEGDSSVFGIDDGTTTAATGGGGGKEGEGSTNNNSGNSGAPRSRSRYALEAEVLRLVKPDDDGIGVRLGEDTLDGGRDGGASSSSSSGNLDGSIAGGGEDHHHNSTNPSNDGADNEPESQEPSVLAARAKEMLKVPGVYYDSARMIWRAFWHEGGRRVIRYFTVNKHGFKRAHELALLTRRQAALAMQQRRRQATAGLVLAANEGGGNGGLPSPPPNTSNNTTSGDGTTANTPTLGAGLGKSSSSPEETSSISNPSGLLTASTTCSSTGNGQTSTGGENHLMSNHSGGGAASAGGGGSDGIPGAAQSAQASSAPPGHSPCAGGIQPPSTSGSLGRPPNSLGNSSNGRVENGIVGFGNSREGGGSELHDHHNGNNMTSSDGSNSLQSSSPANYGVRQMGGGGGGSGGVVLGGGGGEGTPGDANVLTAPAGLGGGPVPSPGGAGGQGFFSFLPQIPQGPGGDGTDNGRTGGDLTTGGVPPPHHPLLYPIPPAVSSASTGGVGGTQSDMSQQNHLGLATSARVGGGETGNLVGVIGGGDSITPTEMLGSHHRGTLDIPLSPPECPTPSPDGSAGVSAPSSSSSPSGVAGGGGNTSSSSGSSGGGSSSSSSSSGGGGNSRVDYLERVSQLPREDQVEWSEEFKAWVVTPPQVPDDQFFPTSRAKHEQQGGGGTSGGASGGRVQYTAEGKEILKMFTIRKYGFRVARERAIEWRNRRREKAKLDKEQYKPKQQAPSVSVPGLLMAGATAAGNVGLRPSPVGAGGGGDHPGIMGVAGIGTLRHPSGHPSPYPSGQENMLMGFGVSLVGANPAAASKAMLQIQQQQQQPPPTANVQLGDPRSAASPSFSTSTTCSSNPRSPPSSIGPAQQPHLNHMMMGATGGCVTPFPSPDPSAASSFLRMPGGGGGSGTSAGGPSNAHPPPPSQQQQPSSDGRSATNSTSNMMLNPSTTTTTTNTSDPSSLLCPSPGLVPPSLPQVMGHGPGTAVSTTQNPFFPFASQPAPNSFVSSPFSTMSFPTNPQQTAPPGTFSTTTSSLHSPPCSGPPSSQMPSSAVTIPPPPSSSSAGGPPPSTAAAAAAAAALSGPSPAQLLLQQQQEQQRQQRQQMQQQQQQGLNKGSGTGGEGGTHRHGEGDSCGGSSSHNGTGVNGGGGGGNDDEMSGGEASVEAVGVMRNAVSHILRNLQEVCIPGLLCSCTLESDSFNYLATRLDEWTRAVHAHRQLCGSVLSNPEKALEVEKKKRKDNNSSNSDKAKVKQEDERHPHSHQGPNSDMEGTKKKGNHEDEGWQQQQSSSPADPATDPQAATMVLAPYLKLFAQCIRKNRLPNEMEAEVQVLLLDALVHLGALSGFKGAGTAAGGGGTLMLTPATGAPAPPPPHSHHPHHPHNQQPHQQQVPHHSPTSSSLPSGTGQQLSSPPPPPGSVGSSHGGMSPFQQQISTMSGGGPSFDNTAASDSQRCGGSSLPGLGALSQPLSVPLPSSRIKTEEDDVFSSRLKEEKTNFVKTEDGGSMMVNMMRGIDEGESSSSCGGNFSCLSVTGTPVNNDSSMPMSFRQSEEEGSRRGGGEDSLKGQLHHIGSQVHMPSSHFHEALPATTSTTTTTTAANGSRGISSLEEGSDGARPSVSAGSAPPLSQQGLGQQQRNGEGDHRLEERKPEGSEGARIQGDLLNLAGGNLCCPITSSPSPVTTGIATSPSFMMTGRSPSGLNTEEEASSSCSSTSTTVNNSSTADDVSRLGGKKRVAAGDDFDGKNREVEERERKRSASIGNNAAGGGVLSPGAAGVGTLSSGVLGVDHVESLQRNRRGDGEKTAQGMVGGVVAASLSNEQIQNLFACKIGETTTGIGGDGEGSSEMTGLLPSSSASTFSPDLIMYRTTNGDEKERGNGGGGDGNHNADEETRADLLLNTSSSNSSHNLRNEKGEPDPLQQQQQQMVYIEG